MLRDGAITSAEATLTPLTGGVSSDVYLVRGSGVAGREEFVVKQALAQLRVRAEWHADPARIVCEENYFKYAGERMPGVVPSIFVVGEGYFAMDFIPDLQNWKAEMLVGRFDQWIAGRVGEILGTVHRLSYGDPLAEALFPNHAFFHELRIHPYLLTTAERTPALRDMLVAEAERLGRTHECLVHGDYSPKNMLVGPGRVVVLDAETANFGDGAFDLAFVLTHLHLKGLLHGENFAPAQQCVWELIRRYFDALSATPARQQELEARTARLLQMILLGRVEGKSPAEYLREPHNALIRRFIHESLPQDLTLPAVSDAWFGSLVSL